LLQRVPSADLLGARLSPAQLEIASCDAHHVLTVRTLQQTHGADCQNALIECVRSLLSEKGQADSTLTIGWLDGQCPLQVSNQRITIQHAAELLPAACSLDASPGQSLDLLHLASTILLEAESSQYAHAANLLPQPLLRHRRWQASSRSLFFAAGLCIFALVLGIGALKISTHRYRVCCDELARRIAAIKTQGESVGMRIDQLETLRLARRSGNDFYRILTGLYHATPPGLSYNQVELTEDGVVRLHGQADSLELPFLLPERLEKEPPFTNVLIHDAGRSRRGEGSVAEFRITCKLKRDTSP
jgi:hypothetical protein